MTGAWAIAVCLFFAQSASDLYQRAAGLLERRDLDAARSAVAEALADEALQLAPQNADALYEKGRCRFERADYAGSAAFGEHALRSLGETPASAAIERRIRYLLVRAYQKIGNPEMAAKHQAVF